MNTTISQELNLAMRLDHVETQVNFQRSIIAKQARENMTLETALVDLLARFNLARDILHHTDEMQDLDRYVNVADFQDVIERAQRALNGVGHVEAK